MNKWIKNGMTGLVIGTSGIAAAETPFRAGAIDLSSMSEIAIDALDLAGGSKLKDRMIVANDDEMALVYALVVS